MRMTETNGDNRGLTDLDELRTAMGAPRRAPGEARRGGRPRARLTGEIARVLVSEGYTCAQIAAAVGVSRSTVDRRLRGQ